LEQNYHGTAGVQLFREPDFLLLQQKYVTAQKYF